MSEAVPQVAAPSCVTCGYSKWAMRIPNMLLCRRYPPTVVPSSPANPVPPLVPQNWWCGEYTTGTPAPQGGEP